MVKTTRYCDYNGSEGATQYEYSHHTLTFQNGCGIGCRTIDLGNAGLEAFFLRLNAHVEVMLGDSISRQTLVAIIDSLREWDAAGGDDVRLDVLGNCRVSA